MLVISHLAIKISSIQTYIFFIELKLRGGEMGTKVDLKVVLLGKEYGGKTSLAERFLYTRFQEHVPYQNVSSCTF